MDQKAQILTLADTYGRHLKLSHWAVSMRAVKRGDFFDRWMKNPSAGCTMRTGERLVKWFSDNWPEDLEWPADIARPKQSKNKEAA